MYKVEIENESGIDIRSYKLIPPIKNRNMILRDETVGGDAPKDFIKMYRFGESRRSPRKQWASFIAKVGQKWYPNESVTEHLLTRIGQVFGLNVADSCLMRIDGQIRFLSKYFLKKDQNLVHGAQIFAGYLEDDEFVATVEKENLSHELFTFQFVEQAIMGQFPLVAHELMVEFVRMVAYDAIVGNNDRHYYNWGVIQNDLSDNKKVEFAPIYDTARALFWNHSDHKLCDVYHSKDKTRREVFLQRYIEQSQPKTGWNDQERVNHFELINRIANDYPKYRPILLDAAERVNIEAVKRLLEQEFCNFMIPERREYIVECLSQRLDSYNDSL